MKDPLELNPASGDGEPFETGRGKLDRWPYFFWGFGLMVIKYNLDRAIAVWGFGRTWFVWNYIKPGGYAGLDALPPSDRRFYFILLLTSLPFLCAGVVLTLRRLRSAGLSAAYCMLFFVPVLNLIFFVVLAVIPAKGARTPESAPAGWLSWLPTSAMGSALASAVLVGLAGIGLTVFSVQALSAYGWGLFVGLPFVMGMVSVLIYGSACTRTLGSCILVSLLSVVFAGIGLFFVAVEGAICLLMASPIALLLALFGGIIAHGIVTHRHARLGSPGMCVILAAVPLTMGLEKQADEPPPLFRITTSVVINAPPERVWSNVVSFSQIPDRRELLFHTGIAYPIRSRIDGSGVRAIRHCIFSTGEFVEPITYWDEPRVLRFSVANQPEPMEELSPYPRLKTPHLHGYLRSHAGEFRLTPLPGGATRLEGTTWYTDQIWPGQYWKLWSDYIIHHIHQRVLDHIKAVSEGSPDG